jgi:glutamine synthetase
MSSIRFTALEQTLNRKPQEVKTSSHRISDYFGENAFNQKAMRQFLSEGAFKSVNQAINHGSTLDRKVADLVASGMKSWAMSKGATHYTHWFQPLTGRTAEKHDSFNTPAGDGTSFETFDGAQLIQQEPDASSFPNGGIRNTFEARGYTAWDPTSPAFIIGETLCIPTVFIAYTGEALDYKTPLLRALHSIDKSATDVCQYFDKSITKVTATLGWEQEYFLVDSALAAARPDVLLTGRTLFGHSSSKGQQLDDHYFGAIPSRANAFIRDFEYEVHRLGVPVMTRHNEVAPNQFECAPLFEECNLAVDHNSLLMDVMERVGEKHNFKVLLHEKPFAGINGSGKHNNWSLGTDSPKHRNLLNPGNTPKTNLRFLTFFINTIRAVAEHDDLLRATIAGAGNDHRLGGNEAPPAIISIFIGSQLSKILNEVESKVSSKELSSDEKTELKLNIGKIPELLLDNTDRNRTSPFAFTGNKFEFRAVGSTANCANPMTVLNTAMSSQLKKFKIEVDALINGGKKKDDAIIEVLRRYILEAKKIIFDGNGYGEEWVKVAKERGLNNKENSPEALDFLITDKAKKLFGEEGVLSPIELEARYEIELEKYKLTIQIESRVMADMGLNHIIPTAVEYQKLLVENVNGLKAIFGEEYEAYASEQIDMIKDVSLRIQRIRKNITEMTTARKAANKMDTVRLQAGAYCDTVIPFFDQIRKDVDKLELVIDNKSWPLPKYRELLFTK